MTPDCIAKVHRIQNLPEFAQLTIEQLLYACIRGSDFKETAHVMYNTDWSKYCSDEANLKLIDCRHREQRKSLSEYVDDVESTLEKHSDYAEAYAKLLDICRQQWSTSRLEHEA